MGSEARQAENEAGNDAAPWHRLVVAVVSKSMLVDELIVRSVLQAGSVAQTAPAAAGRKLLEQCAFECH